jgi:succinate dehydrogenase/fumarate reductase flavoprotein subunit
MAREPMEQLTTDLLIVGSGGAGLFAAIHALKADPRLAVTVVVKGLLGKTGCTRMVQGGYNAVLDPADSLALHLADTLRAGGWINDQELAWTLVREAPERIRELVNEIGCRFDLRPDGRIHQKPFAGQSFDRTIHRGDLTGIEIVSRLQEQAQARGARVLEDCRALDLVLDRTGRVAGAVLLDMRTGAFLAARAKVVLLATGGCAPMYRVFAASLEKSGDGIAMAYRAGAELVDMEQMQFHPTGLIVPGSGLSGSVLEEGLRGAGGRLYNALGERFMQRYDPVMLERSTRDLVARAIFTEIQEGRGTANEAVYLDVSHLGAEFVEREFPGMVERCRSLGLDLARAPVEVGATAHFHMGGVVIDPDCHTGIEGLLVAGEDAGGVHGGNRLGGNGVAESTVFGARAGDTAAALCAALPLASWPERAAGAVAARALAPFARERGEDPYALRDTLRDLMWRDAGLIRTGEGLRRARRALAELRARFGLVRVTGGRAFNPEWQVALDVGNMLVVADLLVRAAAARDESRGSHYRADHPAPDDTRWLRTIRLRRAGGPTAPEDAPPSLWTVPVDFTRLRPVAA